MSKAPWWWYHCSMVVRGILKYILGWVENKILWEYLSFLLTVHIKFKVEVVLTEFCRFEMSKTFSFSGVYSSTATTPPSRPPRATCCRRTPCSPPPQPWTSPPNTSHKVLSVVEVVEDCQPPMLVVGATSLPPDPVPLLPGLPPSMTRPATHTPSTAWLPTTV